MSDRCYECERRFCLCCMKVDRGLIYEYPPPQNWTPDFMCSHCCPDGYGSGMCLIGRFRNQKDGWKIHNDLRRKEGLALVDVYSIIGGIRPRK